MKLIYIIKVIIRVWEEINQTLEVSDNINHIKSGKIVSSGKSRLTINEELIKNELNANQQI
jgi:ABC-type cobalamin/Fe3+-siderophores transport system ATPase subunit